MPTIATVLLFCIGIPLYWAAGVVVSVMDFKVRTWMQNNPRWEMNPPMNIKPNRIVFFWLIYLALVVVVAPYWFFSKGANIAHKYLLVRWNK